ncbi:efflux RND transporter periplasmic adaptor subunit [Stieleria varia]|uniref:Macrolide transporter subunit MacA n=1 Tax=Stieleria varia TaxID=2528005 RepID=A0A5C6BC74_9BACT|nr:efflux RND transporter periplasmic adaptor subunit [Stieleria varia]TWU08134.1 macrolide transporter subunit MacA [Stieleria varia]
MNALPDSSARTSVAEVTLGRLRELERHLDQTAAIAELLAVIGSADELTIGCRNAADRLKRDHGAEKVVIAQCDGDDLDCHIAAVSEMDHVQRKQTIAVDAQAVLHEAVADESVVVWIANQDQPRGGLLAHRRFAKQYDCNAVISSVLKDHNGAIRGAWMVAGDADRMHCANVATFMSAAGPVLASVLNLATRAEAGRLEKTMQSAKRFAKSNKGRVVCAALAFLTLLLCVPVTYRPKCDCTVEPVVRRFVAAPFAGPLKQAFVSAGDEVHQDQVLASMEGREVRWELAGARADLHRAEKERAGHMAIHDSGQAEVARHDADRLRMRIELLENRNRSLEIRCPIDGIVVNGDLDEAIGMPLETGQTLFEVAPLEQMVVEIAVSEDDYAYVQPGMAVTVRLNAYPLRTIEGTIARIHPRSEIRDEQNVFVAEVGIDNSDQTLRPGMQGRASIQSSKKSLGWILFHRPYHALITWLGE